MEITDEFKTRWEELDKKFEFSEPFPEYVSQYAFKIKEFMKPENRKYQGALGNSRGMLDAVIEYANTTTIDHIERFRANIGAIFEFLMKVRQTSQVPLNTTFFINQKLKKLPEKDTNVDLMKQVLKEECDFHVKNYKRARERIANTMSSRIIDRCEEYNIDNITIGTHCHSGAVVDAIIKSKKYVKQVIVSKTEPEQQGVLTAQDLCKAGIKVNFINLEQYSTEFRKVNMFLFGIDAVSVEGTVLNKAGTRMIATIARTKDLPVYFLGETYKYARSTLFGGLVRIERRDVAENLIFNHLSIDLKPFVKAGLLETNFQAFDTTKPEFYDSIVSEQGFLPMREAFEREWAAYL